MSKKREDLVGRRFGRLVVETFDRQVRVEGGTRLFWICRCDCGTVKSRPALKLRSGALKSCGECKKPGGNREDWPGYSSLKGAIGRCYNPNHKAYKDYGGRGIRVCDRWRFGADGKTGFECFFNDVGQRPEGRTLDRIDVNGHYEPGNCRWATKKKQQQNQRRAIYSNVGGVSVPLKKYVARLGLCYESVRFRVRRRNETVSDAVRGLLARRAA